MRVQNGEEKGRRREEEGMVGPVPGSPGVDESPQ
tara:strand:+ start:88 stop:189 length:102 start_codon:yes stop_codon:yes gene_type:complete